VENEIINLKCVTLEQYNGYEFHNRILRVHFDKFAASHQRFREHEANTFGQRQIHDPASIELLRQTYLTPTPQQPSFNAYMMPATPQQPQSNYYSPYIQPIMPMVGYPQYHSPSFSHSTSTSTNNATTTYNNNNIYNTSNGYAVSPPLPQQQWNSYQTENDVLSSLSTSLNNINLSPHNISSAGLMNNNNQQWNNQHRYT
jgi:hypothetical protein